MVSTFLHEVPIGFASKHQTGSPQGPNHQSWPLSAPSTTTNIEEAVGKIRPDIVIEATGVGALVFDAMAVTGSYGIVALTGVSPAGRTVTVDAGSPNREIVSENDAVLGSVNAILRHYQQAADALAKADLTWLTSLITRRVPLTHRAAVMLILSAGQHLRHICPCCSTPTYERIRRRGYAGCRRSPIRVVGQRGQLTRFVTDPIGRPTAVPSPGR